MIEMFDKPKVIGFIGDTNSGKSNFLYWLISHLQAQGDFNLVTYGLRKEVPKENKIWSLPELEETTNSIIILDEVMTLFDLDDRKKKAQVETTLRLINHNNNILVLSMLPENCKKFISSKINTYLFKKSTIPDFINGSLAKRVVEMYNGPERGSIVLNVPVDKCLTFNKGYKLLDVPYMEEFDTKKSNKPIIRRKEG